ncbi:membrane protein [soil metagenome]
MTDAHRRLLAVVVWLAAAAIIAVSVVWGRAYQRESPEIFLGAAPLVGRDFRNGWEWRFGWGLVGAGAVAVLLVVSVVRDWWSRVRLRWVVSATAMTAAVFAVLLALTDGADGVLYGAVHPTEYLANLQITPPAAEFVRTFVERIGDYTVHVRGHPPGFVLLLMAMDSIGLGGGWPAALLSVAATAVLPAAVLVTVWATAGPHWMRRSAPFLVVAPYALWMVTSADAVFTAIGACGVAAAAVGFRCHGGRALVAGAIAGLLLATLLFMTYGAATYLLVPITLAVFARRRQGVVQVVFSAVAIAALVTVGFASAGFWWFAGAAETRLQYWAGTAQFRTWTYFGIANIAVALIALGPATLAGLLRLRDRSLWIVVAAGMLALLASHASQYTRAEVERIWLLFYPWIAVAGAAIVDARRVWPAAAWVGIQATSAILLQAVLVSKW